MSATLLKLLVVLAIVAVIAFGLRRIWREWTAQFRKDDAAALERSRRERGRPDVVTLTRDEDGVFRSGAENAPEKNERLRR